MCACVRARLCGALQNVPPPKHAGMNLSEQFHCIVLVDLLSDNDHRKRLEQTTMGVANEVVAVQAGGGAGDGGGRALGEVVDVLADPVGRGGAPVVSG